MNCEEFMSLLDRFADLNERETAQLEEHASICDNCRSELEFMKSIMVTAQSLPPIEPPADFLQTVNNRLDKELAAEPKIVYFMRHAKPYINRYGTVAACLAIGIAIGANGNMLVSRMNNNGDGVISETTTVTESNTTQTSDTAVSQSVAVPVVPASEAPVITAAPVKASDVNMAAAAKKPSENVNTVITATVAPTAKPVTTVEATPIPTATTVPQITATPEVQATPEIMIIAEGNEGIAVASADTVADEMPVGYSIRMISEPETTPEVYAEANVAQEYTIAQAEPVEETAYVAPLSSTIMVKEADAERAKEIIMEYVEATYGNYYMITGDKLYSLSLRLDGEGIWYYANLTDTGAKVSFKLVTM